MMLARCLPCAGHLLHCDTAVIALALWLRNLLRICRWVWYINKYLTLTTYYLYSVEFWLCLFVKKSPTYF